MKLNIDIDKANNSNKKSSSQLIVKIAGFVLGLSLLIWFIKESDINLNDIGRYFRIMNWRFVFILISTFIAYLLASKAWQQCFYLESRVINIFQLFSIRLIGESLAQINPTNVVAGESIKAYIMKRKGFGYKESIVSLTISRLIIIFSGISFISIGTIIFMDDFDFIKNKYIVYSILLIVILLFSRILFLLHKGKGLLYLLIKLFQIVYKLFPNNKTLPKIINNLREVDVDLIDFYKHKKLHFAYAFILSFVHYIFGALEYYIILSIFDVDITILSCIIIEIGIIIFKASGSFVPGQIGVEEYGNKFLLELVGVQNSELWVIVSVLRRLRQIIWIGIGFIMFIIVMRNTKNQENGNIIYNS
jgi:uncharacterized protein (TIRG00374 family)